MYDVIISLNSRTVKIKTRNAHHHNTVTAETPHPPPYYHHHIQ